MDAMQYVGDTRTYEALFAPPDCIPLYNVITRSDLIQVLNGYVIFRMVYLGFGKLRTGALFVCISVCLEAVLITNMYSPYSAIMKRKKPPT